MDAGGAAEAWDCELLFNVCGAEESAEPWNVAQRRKPKIQETLDQSTAVAGRGVFLEHYCDNRDGSTATADTSGTRAQIT